MAAEGFGNATADSVEGEAEEDDGSALPVIVENIDHNANDTKEAIVDIKCLENSNIPTRTNWCEKDMALAGKNISDCVKVFCNMCCMTLSKDLDACTNNCKANTKPSDMDASIMLKCATQKDGENFAVKKTACQSCCKENSGIYITEKSSEACNSECYKNFDKIDGADGTNDVSFAAEE